MQVIMKIISSMRKALNFIIAKPEGGLKPGPVAIMPKDRPFAARLSKRGPSKGESAAPLEPAGLLGRPKGPLAALMNPVAEIRRRLAAARNFGPAPKNRAELLKAWELQSEAAVVSAMIEGRLRIWIFSGSGLISSFAMLASGNPLLALLPIAPAALGVLTSLWRLSILGGRSFVSFPGWLAARAARFLGSRLGSGR